jgi:hypothetical protein
VGQILRRLWHQRLQQLAHAGCQYTRKRWERALNCPGYLLGDRDARGVSCDLHRLCPYCHAEKAALAYDNAMSARLEFARKWKRPTAWYLTRLLEPLPGQVGKLVGTSDDLHHNPRRVAYPLSLVLVADGIQPDRAWAVPETDVGLARAVSRMFAYPPWLLTGPADAVARYLDKAAESRQQVTGCLRMPSSARSLAARRHNAFLPPRKAFIRPDASCATLEALKGTLRDYDHVTEVRLRLKLAPDIPIVVTSMRDIDFMDFLKRPPRPVEGAVNVVVADYAGYQVGVPVGSVARHFSEIHSDGCKWLPLRCLCPPGSTAPPTDAIWRRQESVECKSASRERPLSTKPKKHSPL